MKRIRFKRDHCILYKWFFAIFLWTFVLTGAVEPARGEEDVITYPTIALESETINDWNNPVQKFAKTVRTQIRTAQGMLTTYTPTPEPEPTLEYVGDWTISFYCPCEICCGEWATGCTASGVLAQEWHTVATDQFPFGTQLYVEGLGNFVVEDTGVTGEWLDVFVNDHQEALDLGLQIRSVYIVR